MYDVAPVVDAVDRAARRDADSVRSPKEAFSPRRKCAAARLIDTDGWVRAHEQVHATGAVDSDSRHLPTLPAGGQLAPLAHAAEASSVCRGTTPGRSHQKTTRGFTGLPLPP